MNIVMIGGSTGIGYEYYKKAIQRGDHVKILSRSQHDVFSGDWIEFDIMSHLNDDKTFPETFEVIDAFIYMPGSVNLKAFRQFSKDDVIEDYKLNVLGAFEAIKHYHKNLLRSESASITFFSSVVVQTGMSFHSVVGMSKGAIEGLTRNLAAEFAPKIRVNAIAPSLVKTSLTSKLTSNDKAIENIAQKHPLKRIGETSDLSDMLFVLTHLSPWMTGQVLAYDGGISSIR